MKASTLVYISNAFLDSFPLNILECQPSKQVTRMLLVLVQNKTITIKQKEIGMKAY
jgi:hypothetical protein